MTLNLEEWHLRDYGFCYINDCLSWKLKKKKVTTYYYWVLMGSHNQILKLSNIKYAWRLFIPTRARQMVWCRCLHFRLRCTPNGQHLSILAAMYWQTLGHSYWSPLGLPGRKRKGVYGLMLLTEICLFRGSLSRCHHQEIKLLTRNRQF